MDKANKSEQNFQTLSDTAIVGQRQSSNINLNNVELNMEKISKSDMERSTELVDTQKVIRNTDTENKKSGHDIRDYDSLDSQSFDTSSDKEFQNNGTSIQVGSDIKSRHSLLKAEILSLTSSERQLRGTYNIRNSDIINSTASNEETKVTNVSTIYFNAKKETYYDEISGIHDKYPEKSIFQSSSSQLVKKSPVQFATYSPQTSDNCNETNEKEQETSEIKLKPFVRYFFINSICITYI